MSESILFDLQMSYLTKNIGLNFCRTFISTISLILERVGSNLVHTLLNPPQVLSSLSFLLGVSLNEQKGSRSIELFLRNHSTVDEI